MKNKFFLIEPSKVANQHITLIEGFLKAIKLSQRIQDKFDITFYASDATYRWLPNNIFSQINCKKIFVMDSKKRWLILKTLVEVFQVHSLFRKIKKNDFVIVTCLLPTSLLIIEFTNIFFKKKLHVVLHGEIEGIFNQSQNKFKSIGYWSSAWIKYRPNDSLIKLIVLDDFIKERLVQYVPVKLSINDIYVLHHPISNFIPINQDHNYPIKKPNICFIGFRTMNKGYESFVKMSKMCPEYNFLAIGDNKVEFLGDNSIEHVNSEKGFLENISICDVAIFPYIGGYSCSLSAAAMDALSLGIPILALELPFFINLEKYFGVDVVKTFPSADDLLIELKNYNFESSAKRKSKRLEALNNSKFSLELISQSFEELLFEKNGEIS